MDTNKSSTEYIDLGLTHYCTHNKKISRKNLLRFSTMLSFLAFYPTLAMSSTAVSSWAELEAAKSDADIVFANDIQGAASTVAVLPITFDADGNQTIDGANYSFIGSGSDGYLKVSNRVKNFTMENLGKSSDGAADNSTFSYIDLNGNTVYKTIEKSVNSFAKFLYKDSNSNDETTFNVKNSVFTENTGTLFNFVQPNASLNITDGIFYQNSSTDGSSLVNVNNSINSFSMKNTIMAENSGKYNLNLRIADMVLEDSVFYKNTATDDGGVLYGSGSLQIKNSYFLENSSSNGGAMHLTSGNVLIEDSKFEKNTTTNYGDGGAIWLSSGNTVEAIKNSQFLENVSDYDGGAISSGGGLIKNIENSVFDGNKARTGGGAIWGGLGQGREATPIYYKNTTFSNNEAGVGGAVLFEGATEDVVYIADSQFTNNKIGGEGHSFSYYNTPLGGAALFAWISASVSNTTFENNTAVATNDYSAGGALCFLSDAENVRTLNIVDSTFSSNSAVEGGALYIQDTNAVIAATANDVVFSGNTASATTDDYNAGSDIYYATDTASVALSLNAAENKKVIFNGTIAAYENTDDEGNTYTATIDINKSDVTYNTYDGATQNQEAAGTSGEIQFNGRVGDADNYFTNINLYNGVLSIGQNADNNASTDNPDGYLNDNNFYVQGNSTLNTVNGVIGEFAPKTFEINAALDYQFDIDLANTQSDKINSTGNGIILGDNGSVNLAILNIITDATESNTKVTYSDTNVGGALKDDYQITTSTATYEVTAENDDSGSHLIFDKSSEIGGLPKAIEDASDVYSNTSGKDEIIEAWNGNDLKSDLVINGNGNAFRTENKLDGINVGADKKLTMNDVADMKGFNYAIFNEGVTELNDTTISDEIINNGSLEVNDNVSLGPVSGNGTTNINSDQNLQSTISGNTVNVNKARLSGVDKLAADTTLKAIGGTVALDNKTAKVKAADFDANSTLELTVNSSSDYGNLTADTITVANGATLRATLAQGIVSSGDPVSLQLLKANNTDFNNFTDSFDNNMYHFEKADKDGLYTISRTSTAEDVAKANGGTKTNQEAAKAWVDGDAFAGGIGSKIADGLADLAQNDGKGLLKALTAVAPNDAPVVQTVASYQEDLLFKTIASRLRNNGNEGIASGDLGDGLSLWVRAYMGKSKLDDRNAHYGFDFDSKGVIAALEKKFTPSIKAGIGYHYDEADVDAYHRDTDIDTNSLFAYGEYKPNAWFVHGTASYAMSDYDEDKHALGNTFKARYSVDTYAAQLLTGYELQYVTPEAGLRYYRIKRHGYNDSAAQAVSGKDMDMLTAVAGARFGKDYTLANHTVRPEGYVGVTYDLVSDRDNAVVGLANGASYAVHGKRLNRFGVEAGAGITAELTDRLSANISYMGGFRKDYQSHTGMIGLKYAF